MKLETGHRLLGARGRSDQKKRRIGPNGRFRRLRAGKSIPCNTSSPINRASKRDDYDLSTFIVEISTVVVVFLDLPEHSPNAKAVWAIRPKANTLKTERINIFFMPCSKIEERGIQWNTGGIMMEGSDESQPNPTRPPPQSMYLPNRTADNPGVRFRPGMINTQLSKGVRISSFPS